MHDEKYGWGGVVVGFAAPFLTVQKLFQLPRVVAILNSGNQPTSGNVGSVMNVSGMVAKCCGSRWNRITRSLRSIVRPIFTSGFAAAIFKFGSRPTSDNVEEYQSVISKSDLAKIVGATDSTVEIASLSHVQWRI